MDARHDRTRYMSLVILASGLLLVSVVSVYLAVSRVKTGVVSQTVENQKPVMAKVTINNKIFLSEVMLSSRDQAQGLSGRAALAESQGMLFVFRDASKRAFWMKDMRFAIDIIFIKQNKIVDVTSGLPWPAKGELPATYRSSVPSDMVFEVVSGTALANGWLVGTPVQVDYLPQ